MRPSLLVLALLPLACFKPAGPEVWSAGGVRVLLQETRALDERFAEYRLEVTDGTQRLCWSSSQMGGAPQRRRELGKAFEKDGYLFVPASCGGGNASKCRGWQAFALKPKLRWLGNFTGRWDGSNVSVYDQGVFYDTGDMLEINDLLNHSQSPRYAMAYTDAGEGGLAFQSEKTWQLNAEAYKGVGGDAPGLLYKAGLAKLCGKNAELRAQLKESDRVLNPKGRELFRKALAQVPTRNVLPNAFIPVGACPPEKP